MDFELLSGVFSVLIGLMIVVFRSKYVSLQKRQASKMKTFWSKEILEKGQSDMERTSLIVGFVIIGIVMVANTYGIFN